MKGIDIKIYKCEQCRDTGWYGDNGPGMKGNREYIPCECQRDHSGLKPCPFCGSCAEIFQQDSFSNEDAFVIGCRTEGCFAEINERATVSYISEKYAIEAWNKRAE